LIDQWLDLSVCDFEAAVAAIVVARDGKEVDAAIVAEDVHKFLKVLEGHLSGRKFLAGDELSIADISIATGLSVVLTTLLGE
jgi:glutathione S-transferase